VRAWYHLRAARADLQRYHNPEAIRHLQACLHAWPDDPEALLLAARAARRAGAYADADRLLQKYQQARGLDDPGSFEQLLLSAERTVDQVIDVCHRRVDQGDPEAPLILEAVARGCWRQYRLNEARLCLDRWLQLQPENPQALCLDGQFRLDYQHAPAAAVASYRRAVQIDPDHEEARLGLAVALLESKDYADALPHLEHLGRVRPENLRVRVGLAECRYSLGQADEARRLVEGVLAEQPEYAPALALRGRLALDGGSPAEAETWLRRAAERDPRDYQARYNLILCLHQNGHEEEAKRLERELKQRDEDVRRFDEIIQRDLARNPRDPALHCTLGRLLLRGGHVEEGLRWLHSALRLDPQYAPAHQALREYHRQATAQGPQE
jgi:tetratricopeptide (TPR) repeat protein